MAVKRIGAHTHEFAIKTASFHVRDDSRYIINHPLSVVGNTVDALYSYGAITASASSTVVGAAINVFQNNPDGSSQEVGIGWGTGWTSHDVNSATPGRLLIDFGEEIDIVGMEWQGEGNTGYGPISGPNAVRIRFGVNPLVSAYASTTNVQATVNHNWADLDWGANTGSPNGLAEYLDLRTGGNARTARYVAIDCDTSHDTRNMSVRHILFHHEVPAGGVEIQATIDDTVKSFSFRDGNGNTNTGSRTEVVVGTDTVVFGPDSVGVNFEAVRDGSTFKFYGSDGTITEGNV